MSSNTKLIHNKFNRRSLIAGAGALPLLNACGFLSNTSNVDARAAAVRDQAFSQYPSAAQASKQASATLLFPEIVKAGFGLGGAHGDGVMYVDDQIVSRYNMTAATVGLQAGIESFSMMLLFMNPQSLSNFNKFLGFDVGADVEYALPRQGLNFGTTASAVVHDVYALIFNQAGIMAGATIQGAKYTQI